MSNRSKNENALRFNVAKKLAQLQKVIQLFRAQNAEREYQLNYLHDKYNQIWNESFNNYLARASEAEKGIIAMRKEIDIKMKKVFTSKIDLLQVNYNKSLEEIHQHLEDEIRKIETEIKSIIEQANELKTQFNSQSQGFEDEITAFQGKLKQISTELSEKHKQEVLGHQQEAQRKLNEFLQQSKEEIEKIKTNHIKEMEELKKSMNGQTDFKTQIFEKLHQLKINLNDKVQMLISLKENINQIVKTHSNNIIEWKKKTKEICSSMNDSDKVHQNEIKDLEKQLADLQAQLKISQTQYEDAKNNSNKVYEEQLLEKQHLIESEINKMKNEIEERTRAIRETCNNFDVAIQNLMSEHSTEIEKIRKENEKIVAEAGIKDAARHKELLILQDSYEKELQQMAIQAKKLKEDLEEQKKKILEQCKKEIDDENLRFEKQTKEIQERIDAELEAGNSDLKKHRDTIKALHDQKDKIIQAHSEKLTEFHIAFSNETQNRLKNCQEELDKLDQILQTEKDSSKSKIESEINDMKEKISKSISNKRNELQKCYEEVIKQIEEEGKDKREIDALRKKYIDLIDKETQKRDGIKLPSSLANDKEINESDLTIKKLEDEKQQFLNDQELDKENINKEWKVKMDQETERHSMLLMRTSLGNDREEKRIALVQEINSLKQENAELESNLRKELQELQTAYEQQKNSLLQSLKEAQNRTDIESLQSDYEKLQNEHKNLLQSFEKSEEDKRKAQADSISKENSEFNKEEEDLKAQTIEAKKNLEKTLFDLKELSKKMEKEYNQKKDYEQKSSQEKLRISQQQLYDRISALQRESENLKSDSVKSEITCKNLYAEREKQNAISIRELQENGEEAYSKKQKDWNVMKDFYDEKISVLEQKVKEGKEKFDSRPPRDQEVELIEKLSMNLKTVTMRLQNAVHDMTEYRTLMVRQEKEYNSRFGKGPKIGVYSVKK